MPQPPRFDVPLLPLEDNRRVRRAARRRVDKRPTLPVDVIPDPRTQEEATARIRDHTADQLEASWRATNVCLRPDCPGCEAAVAVVRIAKHGFDLGTAHNRLVMSLQELHTTGGLPEPGNSIVHTIILRQYAALRALADCCNALEERLSEPAPEPQAKQGAPS